MPRKNSRSTFILLAAASMIVAGVFRGEVQTVLAKAVNLCLECVGIG